MHRKVQRALRSIRRRLIGTGRYSGPAGVIGRLYGKTCGWRLDDGLRITINNPNEWIHDQLLKGVYEPNVVNIARSLLQYGDVYFDVGANIGYHTLVAAQYGAKVHAFEPVPRLARRIRDNLLLNGLGARATVQELALTDRVGLATLYVADRIDDGSHSMVPGVPAKSVEKITVRTTTVDQHIVTSGCGIPAILKIDVEGCESLVLDGAKDTLSLHDPPIVIIETADRLADMLGESARTVLSRLFELGYKVFHIPDYKGTLTNVTLDQITGELANYLAIHATSPRLASIRTCAMNLSPSENPMRGI